VSEGDHVAAVGVVVDMDTPGYGETRSFTVDRCTRE
jgi:hypothetical protein